ncbi:MAG: hypothetical protein AAF479_10220 [Pseudomonadota bacterium]
MDRASWGRGLPFDTWPAQDREMWRDLTRTGDVFEEAGPFGHLRPVSRDAYRLSYAQWLQHLRDAGVDLNDQAPDTRASLARLRRYHEAISHLAPRTQASRFVHLHRVLSTAFPHGDWRRLHNAAKELTRRANAHRTIDKHSKLPPSDVLLEAGLGAIADAQAEVPLTPFRARHHRNGLIVAMLACHAIRRRTLAELTLGRNVQRDDQGYAIWASPEDMKAGRSCMFRVSSLLTEVIDGYLVQARPMFRNGEDPEYGPLWLTFTGTALGPQGIKFAVAAITEARTGHRTTPHAFRHAAMTTMANEEGFDTRHGQGFLDHRTQDISERHYNLATQLDAGRVYARLLESTRKTGRRQRCEQ